MSKQFATSAIGSWSNLWTSYRESLGLACVGLWNSFKPHQVGTASGSRPPPI